MEGHKCPKDYYTLVILRPHILIYQVVLQNMGKNSAKKAAKKAAKFANQKGSSNQTAVQGTGGGGFKLATKQVTSPVVKDLSDIATLVAPTPKFQLPTKKVTQPEPPVAPPSTIVHTVLKPEEGYVLETIYKGDGTINYTKVLVEKPTGWDVILCSKPSVEIKRGTLIRFTPGEYNGKMTVLSPTIISEDTPLTRLFQWCEKQSKTVEELQLGELAKSYMSKNHVGTNDEDKFRSFLAELGILEIVGHLETGRLIIQK